MPLRIDLIEKNKKKNQEDQEQEKISSSTRERQTSNVETAYDRRKKLADLLTQRGFETTLPEENKTETALDRRKELAVLLTKAGYQTKLPERKTADDLFIGGSERASQLPKYEVPDQKPRFTLPSNVPRAEKNSPTTQANLNNTSSISKNDDVSIGDWLKGAARTFSNASFWSVPNTVNQVTNMAFDWLKEQGDNLSAALGVNERDYQNAVQGARNIFVPENDVITNIYQENKRIAQDVMDRSKSAELLYPLADTLGQIALTAGTAGVGAASGLTDNAVRGAMIATDLARNIGSGYTDRIDDGQDVSAAMLGSVLAAIPTTAIEFSGGNEDLIQGAMLGDFGSGWKDWISQALRASASEAGEEILQDPLGGIADIVTGQNPQIFATGFDPSEDSVFNLARMLQSAGYAAAGSLLSAGSGRAMNQGVSRLLQDSDRVYVGNQIRKQDGGNQLLKIAAASESQEVQAQRSEIMEKLRTGQNVSAYSLGKLAESLSTDATTNLVTATKSVQTADNTQDTVRNNAPISNQSAEGISAIDAEIRRYTTPFVQNAVEAQAAQQQSSRAEMIDELAAQYGESGQKAFRAAMSESDNVNRAQNAFRAYYNYGSWGKRMEDVSSAFADSISSDAAYAAFSAGQNDAAASLAAQKAAVKAPSGSGGLVTSSAASTVDSKTRLYLDGIGRALGVQIEIESGERDAQGNLLSNGRMIDGKIYISASSKKPIASVLNHELTHILQERSPEQYREYKNFVASYLDSQNSGWFESQVQRMIDGYESIGESISREMAEDEVVSDAAERFLSDETAINALVKENRSVAQKVLGAIRDIIHRLANIVRGDNDAESTASRLLREQEEVFRQAEKMWAKALAESSSKTDEKKTAPNKKSSAGKAKKTKYQLVNYDEKQKKSWENSKSITLYEDDTQLLEYIEDALSSKEHSKMYFGKIPGNLAARIQDVSGLDVEGFNLTLRTDEIRKILLNSHGNSELENARGQRAITKEDLLLIPDIVTQPDKIDLDDRLFNGKPVIRFTKYIDGRNVVVTYISRKHHDLTVQTMYGGQKKRSLSTVGDASVNTDPHSLTSKTNRGTASDTSISETVAESNQQNVQTLNESPQSRRQLSEYVIGDEDEYEFSHAQPDENYQLEGREDDQGVRQSPGQDIETVGLDVGWLDRHISGAISMDESGTLEDRIDTLKKESEILKNVSVSDEQLEKIAGRVLKEYDSNLDEKEFIAAVKSAVEHIGRRGAKGYEQAFVSIYDEMVRALEQSESLDKSLWDAPDVKEIRKSIRETRLYISDDQKRDFQNFAEYKRDHREFKLVNDPTAMPVDQFYSELSSMYPGYFDAEKMTARDELDEISEWLEAVKPTVVNWYEGNIEQVAAEATADIIHTVNQTKSRKPEAKLTRQMIAQQERFEKRYQQLSNEAEAEKDLQLKQQRERFEKQLDDLREQMQKQHRQDQREDYKNRMEALRQRINLAKSFEKEREKFAKEREQMAESRRKELEKQQTQYEKQLKELEKQAQSQVTALQREDYKNRMQALRERLDLVRKMQQQRGKYEGKLEKAAFRLQHEQAARALDRQQAAERIQEIREANREAKKKASDRRAVSQSRKKIERIVDQLSRKLLKPTDTQNVPVELRGAVSRFLQAIDFRSYRAGEVSDTQKTQRWQDLQNILARISREEDGDGFDGMYFTVDPDMERRMRELMQSGVPVNLSNISREQIKELEKLVRAVDHMVRFVGKIRVEGQMMEATETARQIIDENSGKIKGTTRTTPIALRAKQFFQYDLLDPTRFSDMFGKGFYKIMHNLRMAENDKIRYWSQTESAFEQMLKDNGFTKKSVQKMGEDYRDVIIGGKIGKMSTAQIMSLYLANKREQGRSHLYGGGIALPDSTGRVITRHQKTYQLTEEDVSTITGMLSDSQRRLADAMQRFLSDDVAAWGNRMSRYLYGYDKFTEKNYWPISSDPNYTRSEVSLQQSEAKSATIKNLGMTKALVEKASNPIVIDSAFQVFAKHATQMAAYGAYVGPLEDLNKVMNWQTRHDGNWRSVRETISAAGGREAIRYLYKLIDDVNGQSRSEGDPYSGLMGAAKAASVAGNLRVVVQQPTAYWRAMAVIPPQYLVKGIAGKRVNVEEMLDTAPVAQWKSWGYFRDGVSGSNLLELMQGKTGVRERFVDWSMSLAGKADDMTWRQIYRAVESWVSGTTDLERGSEAFRQEVGKRFTEVVDRTQVVDSVFQRTQAMRNTGFGWKLATSFMAEPLKSYNLLVGSARNFVNAGKGEKGEALRKMLMAALGFAVSSVINAAVQSAWDVGRDKDPDEKIVEKFMQAMFGDTVNDVKEEGGSWYDVAMAAVDGNLAGNFNPMSMIPVLNDVWSMLEGFDPEVMGLSAISDILSSGQTLYKSVSEGSGKYTAGYNAVQFVRKLSAATGLPIGNIYRELESLVNFSITAAGDWLGMDVERLQFEINKLYLNPDQNRNIYYQSILDARAAGDDSLAVEIANYLLSKGIKRSSIETGLANLIAADEANADLISEYAQAYQNRDMEEMSRLEAEGKKVGLSGLDLQNAAERYLKNLEPDSEAEIEAEEEFSEQDFDAAAEYDTGYTIDVLADAIVYGDRNTEQQMRSQFKSSGKTDEDIDKSIKSELKSRMAENAGFESVTQMQDAGEEFDTTTKEYQILHDKYGFTQYGYSDLYEALVDGRGYEAIYDDMLGQTSSGDNTYSAEGIEKEMKSRLQEDFNTRYKGGTGTGWEFYMKKLKEYGKTWDEILTSWKRSKAGQEWNDSH